MKRLYLIQMWNELWRQKLHNFHFIRFLVRSITVPRHSVRVRDKKKGFSEKYIYCSTEDLSSHISSIFTFYIALNLNLLNFTLLQVALCSRGVLYSGVVLKMAVLNKMLRDSVPIFWLWGFYSLSVTASGNHPQEVMLQISPFSMYDHQILVSCFIRTLFHILSWATSQNIYFFKLKHLRNLFFDTNYLK